MRKRSAFAALLLVATVALPARADLDTKHIPADSSCVMHLDLARFKGSTFGKALLATLPEDTEAMGRKSREELGVDFHKDVITLTVIQGPVGKAAGNQPDTSYLVTGTFDVPTFLAALKKHAGARDVTEAYEGHTLYSMPATAEAPAGVDVKREDAKPGFAVNVSPVGAAFVVAYRPDTLVAATTAAALKKLLDVLDGRTPAMTAEQAGTFLPARQEGTYLTLASTDAGFTAFKTAWIVEEGVPPDFGIRHLGFTLGEVGGDVVFAGRAQARDAESAANLKSMMDGIRALMALSKAQGNEQDTMAAAFAEAVAKARFGVDDLAVTAAVRMPADMFARLMINVEPEPPAEAKPESK